MANVDRHVVLELLILNGSHIQQYGISGMSESLSSDARIKGNGCIYVDTNYVKLFCPQFPPHYPTPPILKRELL